MHVNYRAISLFSFNQLGAECGVSSNCAFMWMDRNGISDCYILSDTTKRLSGSGSACVRGQCDRFACAVRVRWIHKTASRMNFTLVQPIHIYDSHRFFASVHVYLFFTDTFASQLDEQHVVVHNRHESTVWYYYTTIIISIPFFVFSSPI